MKNYDFKNSIPLALISLLGHFGLAILIYILFFNIPINSFFSKVPFISLYRAEQIYSFCFYTFCILLVCLFVENNIPLSQKIKDKLKKLSKYLSLIPNWYFITGVIISFTAAFVYLMLVITILGNK